MMGKKHGPYWTVGCYHSDHILILWKATSEIVFIFILNYIQHEYLYYFFQVGGLQMMVGLNYNMQEV